VVQLREGPVESLGTRATLGPRASRAGGEAVSNILTFAVRGIPVAQGSPRAFVAGGRAIVATEASRGFGGRSAPLAAWRHAIATEARAAMGDRPLITSAVVSLTFTWSRPLAHFGTRRGELYLRPNAPDWKTTKPDIDKVARAALDALTGVVFGDDAQVVALQVAKRWGSAPGVTVRIEGVDEQRRRDTLEQLDALGIGFRR
jgi:Holliday junction resolvase RusA-like endonuclease